MSLSKDCASGYSHSPWLWVCRGKSHQAYHSPSWKGWETEVARKSWANLWVSTPHHTPDLLGAGRRQETIMGSGLIRLCTLPACMDHMWEGWSFPDASGGLGILNTCQLGVPCLFGAKERSKGGRGEATDCSTCWQAARAMLSHGQDQLQPLSLENLLKGGAGSLC